MISKQLTVVCLSFGLVAAPVTRAAADGGDLLGGVIVNEANGRFFEPGAGRSVTVGIGWRR